MVKGVKIFCFLKEDWERQSQDNFGFPYSLSPAEYLHSSARFYICGEQGVYRVTNIGGVNDIDLTNRIADK